MELQDGGGLYRDVQGTDSRLGGDTARPRLYSGAMARCRGRGSRARTVRQAVAATRRRPRLCLYGLPHGATDDRQIGERPYAPILGGLHHPQSGAVEPARSVADAEPFAACRGDRETRRGGLPTEQGGERRRLGIGRVSRYRHAGRCGVVGDIRPVYRCGYGYLCRRRAFRDGRAGITLGRRVYQQGSVRQ